MNNNFVRILISGVVATLAQRFLGLNPVSFIGFAFFILVFTAISFAFNTLYPKKTNTPLEQELEDTRKRVRDKKLSKIYKIVFSILFGYIALNSAINYISFEYDLFNKGFDSRNTTSANIITTNKAIKKFSIKNKYYSIHKYKNKYYILQTNKYAKNHKKYLTLNSRAYYYLLVDDIINMPNCKEIIDNLVGITYKEVSTFQMIFIPLWISNKPIREVLQKEFINDIKKTCKNKQEKLKQEQYNKLKQKDLSTLSIQELAILIKKQYKKTAYIKDTRFAIKLFDELNKRPYKQVKQIKNIDVYGYQFMLMKYLNLFKKKETLNKILQKYNYGVVYSFILPVVASPLDIEDQKYSHLRLVDMKNNKRYILHKRNIKHIKVIDSKVIILKKDDTKIVLDNIAKQDQDKIAKLILAMIKNIALIEKEYFTMK